MFQVSDLSKSFGGHPLFRGVTWQINSGDRWGLVGPNGVGKTTLLRCLIGQEPPDTGTVSQPKTATVGYLAQERAGTPGATGGLSGEDAVGRSMETVLDTVVAAIPQVIEIEREMRRLEREMAVAEPGKAEALAHVHADLQDRFTALDGYTVDTRAKEILAGLGFSDSDHAKRIDELSGGWAMRVSLARLLLSKPDLLLLDEPTNHLDLESVVWLEEFLAEYKGAWVVVSHDRYFLNRMVDGIAELNREGMDLYVGSYDDYLEEREQRLALLEKAAGAQAKQIADMERFIERFRYKATKARAAQSRVKALAKVERIEAPKRKRRVLRIRLPEPMRSGTEVMALEGARKAYGANVVYRDLHFSLRRGDRVALVGPNGAGKSTLLKLMAGVAHLDGGHRKVGHNVGLYYYAQHQTDALDPRRSILEELREIMPLDPESTVRGVLGAFLFSGDDVEKKTSVLSGGEKARVALAKMLARPANLLLLDEPTNHLDLASREVLESALADFKGTLAFISHDRYFINSIATRVVEVRREPGEGESRPVEYLGDYDYWQWKRAQEQEAQAPPPSPSSRPSDDPNGYAVRKEARREEEKRKRLVADLEKEIDLAERRKKEIDALLSDPAVFADAGRCKALMDERSDLEEKILPLMERWESAQQ